MGMRGMVENRLDGGVTLSSRQDLVGNESGRAVVPDIGTSNVQLLNFRVLQKFT